MIAMREVDGRRAKRGTEANWSLVNQEPTSIRLGTEPWRRPAPATAWKGVPN